MVSALSIKISRVTASRPHPAQCLETNYKVYAPNNRVLDSMNILKFLTAVYRKNNNPSYALNNGGTLSAMSNMKRPELVKWLASYDEKIYPDQIEKDCLFLNSLKDKVADLMLNEKEALSSIVYRLPDKKNRLLKYVENKTVGEQSTIEEFSKNVAATRGPYTCGAIQSMYSNCKSCKHYKKVMSPIEIKDENFITTEDFGFYEFTIKGGQKVVSKTPAYRDLVKKFCTEYQYITVLPSQTNMHWTGKIWEPLDSVRIYNYAEKHFNPKPTNRHCTEFLGIFKRTNLVEYKDFYPDNSTCINLQNGVFDFKTCELHEHDPKFYMNYMLPYEYDPDAECPNFDNFLAQVTKGNENMQAQLLEFMGYSIINGPCYGEKALILCGEGSNGKSTFVQLIKDLVGEKNYSSLSLSALNNAQNRAQTEGKLVNIGEETSSHALGESDVFKTMVTGGEIDVKKVFEQPYSVRSRTKLIVLCNEVPKSKDRTSGLYRRMLLVPFRAKFSRALRNIDPEIGIKLKRELPGILNRCIEGYKRLKKNRWDFTYCKISEDYLSKYQEENDNIVGWLHENCEIATDKRTRDYQHGWISTKILYQNYTNYCKSTGTMAASQNLLMSRLRALDERLVSEQVRSNGRRIRVIRGINFIED